MERGASKDATPADVRKMKQRSHVLHNRLKSVVDRKDVSVLLESLPAKREFVITVHMTPFQKYLYRQFLDKINSPGKVKRIPTLMLRAYQCLLRVWNHPAAEVIHDFNKRQAAMKKIDTLCKDKVKRASTAADLVLVRKEIAPTVLYFESKKETLTQAMDSDLRAMQECFLSQKEVEADDYTADTRIESDATPSEDGTDVEIELEAAPISRRRALVASTELLPTELNHCLNHDSEDRQEGADPLMYGFE
jgi:SNF2 family DNA or RNA helicase